MTEGKDHQFRLYLFIGVAAGFISAFFCDDIETTGQMPIYSGARQAEYESVLEKGQKSDSHPVDPGAEWRLSKESQSLPF